MTPRVAFIGAGQMARHHVEAVRRLPVPSVLVGVYDPALRQAEAFAAANGTRAFPSLEAMLGSRPDIVHVCTPPAFHFQSAHAALEASAHVYVEKPFALSARDARTLLALATARGRLVCAGGHFDRQEAVGEQSLDGQGYSVNCAGAVADSIVRQWRR